MSIGISDRQYATIWKVEDQGSYSLIRMSTSRKDKRDNSYKNSNWSFVRFVGQAHEKVKDGLPEKTRIKITAGSISWEPYLDSTGEKVYPKNPQVTIFNFELAENDSTSTASPNMDTPPTIDDEELPF